MSIECSAEALRTGPFLTVYILLRGREEDDIDLYAGTIEERMSEALPWGSVVHHCRFRGYGPQSCERVYELEIILGGSPTEALSLIRDFLECEVK